MREGSGKNGSRREYAAGANDCGENCGKYAAERGFSGRSFSLTKAGQEVLRIIGVPNASPKNVHAVADFLCDNSLADGQPYVVRVPVDSSIDNWEWERGSRLACFS